MSSFPEMVACSGCGARWPKNVLDNYGRCPMCWMDGQPPRCQWTVTFRDYDGSRASVECGMVASFVTTYHDEIVASYPPEWEPDPQPYTGERMRVCTQHAAEMAEQQDRELLPEWVQDVQFWTLDGDECSILYEVIQGRAQ